MTDPFGFAAAINWDAVDAHADEIAAIFDKDEECDHPPHQVHFGIIDSKIVLHCECGTVVQKAHDLLGNKIYVEVES